MLRLEGCWWSGKEAVTRHSADKLVGLGDVQALGGEGERSSKGAYRFPTCEVGGVVDRTSWRKTNLAGDGR